MNHALLCYWSYGGEKNCKEGATEFFNALRIGLEEGKGFPFDCPYEVYLLKNKMDAEEWAVAVQVMRGTPEDDSEEQADMLMQWFEACGARYQLSPKGKLMSGTTIQSVLFPYSFSVIDCFGIIMELLDAAEKGDLSRVVQLLGQGVDVNTVASGGWTALILASQNGHLEVVKELIAHGANINAVNAYNETALCMAKAEGHSAIVDLLEGMGARP